jgi:hypothetical protein
MTEKIDLIYWFLAYSGIVIHFLIKWWESKRPLTKYWGRNTILPVIISAVSIPVILIILTEPFVSAMLPLNKLTAFIAGYQTQSALKSFLTIFNKNISSNNEANPVNPVGSPLQQLPNTEEN